MSIIDYKNEADWLAARRGSIGSSEIARIVFTGPHLVWDEKVQGYERKAGNNVLAEIGHRSEDMNARWFADVTGLELSDPGSYAVAAPEEVDPACPITATIDRLTAGAVVELKAAFGDLASIIERATTDDLRHTKLERYYWQVQHQLAVTGLELGYLSIIFFTGFNAGHRWFRCERDERVIAAIKKRAAEFWRCVTTRTPPDWRLATAADISAIRSRQTTTGKSMELEGKTDVDDFAAMDELYKKRSAINKRYEQEKARWLARGGDAERIICGDRQINLRRFAVGNYKGEKE